MSDFGNVFSIVIGITLVLMLCQSAINELNPNANVFITCGNTIVSSYTVNNNCSSLNSNIAFNSDNNPSKPTTTESVSNGFTDIFNAIQSWVLVGFGSTTLGSVLLAPALFLGMTGLSASFSLLIATLWYSWVFFLFIEWWGGK